MPLLGEDCTLINAVERLCGQKPSPNDYLKKVEAICDFPPTGLGYSQFNELLLALNLDRVTHGFFDYVFGAAHIKNFDDLKSCIESFCIKAVRQFGSVKYGFKRLSQLNGEQIRAEFLVVDAKPNELLARFTARHPPLVALKEIEPSETYYLGYLIDAELKAQRASLSADDPKLVEIDNAERRRDLAREKGQFNHDAYLDYDHMDVYVATSMRDKYDFWNINRFVRDLFGRKELSQLNLRYFDPTQAYCPNRLDKGLSEGLMLKRAKCSIYMAGESDTLGKDSELATTLAQGKPVIVYLPKFRSLEEFRKSHVDVVLRELYSKEDPIKIGMRFLKLYFPDGAWTDARVRKWADGSEVPTLDQITEEIFNRAKQLYEKRAETLNTSHPLGLQVNLDTGVANGVLVARDVSQCASLLRRVLLNELVFNLEEDENKTLLLKEQETKSVFRVVTHDIHLTNSFWNFYLKS